MFISHSLIPRKYRTAVNFTAAMVLHCIQEGQLIDIGHLVKKEILELGCIRVDKQPLIFPSLITAFCQEAGVDFGVDGFDLGLGPVDRGTWLHQASERNPSGIRVRTGRKKSVASSSRQQEEIPE